MSKRTPIVGEKVRILRLDNTEQVAKVTDLLATMFTVTYPHSNAAFVDKVEFLYYDPIKGETWEYVT